MKVAAKQMAGFLKNPGDVLGALTYGPDDGLALRHSRTIIDALLGAAYDRLNLIELDESDLKDDPAKLADECGAMSLMGGKRLVWLRGMSEAQAGLIEPCLPMLGADCYLLVTLGECGPRHKVRQLFEQHKKLASLACYRAEGRNLSQAIQGLASQHDLHIEPDALQFLTAELGNHAMVTESEMEKLCLYAHGKRAISLADAKAVIIHNDEHQIDPLCRYFAEGNAAAFDTLWQHLTRDGMASIMLLRSLARYMDRLLTLKRSMELDGLPAHEAVDTARPPIFWSQKDAMARQLSRLSGRAIMYKLHIITQAEAAAKLLHPVGDHAASRLLLLHMHRTR